MDVYELPNEATEAFAEAAKLDRQASDLSKQASDRRGEGYLILNNALGDKVVAHLHIDKTFRYGVLGNY